MARQLRSGFDTVRDLLIFMAGIALGAYAVTRQPPSEGLATIAAGMCIAPAALLPGRSGGKE